MEKYYLNIKAINTDFEEWIPFVMLMNIITISVKIIGVAYLIETDFYVGLLNHFIEGIFIYKTV